jgi:uncharacterized membrane protein
MLSTILWIGSLAALTLVFLPIMQRSLEPLAQAKLLDNLQRRLDPLGWFCLILLTGTGMFQMSGNPNYRGFLAIEDRWALAILIKHGVFLLMIGASAYLTWSVLPQMRRQMLRMAQGGDAKELARAQKQNQRLLQWNLILAVIVLALTALARVS